jgi:phospholipid-binding lipoprotein MlaA
MKGARGIMRISSFFIGITVLFAVFSSGCAHRKAANKSSLESPGASSGQYQESNLPLAEQSLSVQDENEEELYEDEDYYEDEEEILEIADPLFLWNNGMYHINDKLYFWVFKPVAQGYSAVVPEKGRILMNNFFDNIMTPIRFVNNLLQLKIKSAGNELVRFAINSTVGVVGLNDIAKKELDMKLQDEDLGQTLGSYGLGHGFYIVWPFLGPSSLRDTVGRVGDRFLNPVSYVNPTEAALGINTYETVNKISLNIGEYEDFKNAAIDPYIAIRDAYIQNRKSRVEDEE